MRGLSPTAKTVSWKNVTETLDEVLAWPDDFRQYQELGN